MIKRLFSLFAAFVMMTTVVCSNPVSTYASAGYTVEFTSGELQYVMPGDSRVELTEILATIGIDMNGEITEVTGSNDSLFKPVNEDGTWYIEAVTAFTSTEWLKVKIGEAEYEITVTDASGYTGAGTLTSPYTGTMGTELLDQPLLQNKILKNLFIDCSLTSNSVNAYVDNQPHQRELGYSGISLPNNKTLYYDRYSYNSMGEGAWYIYFLNVTYHTISYNSNQATGGSTPATITYGVLSDGYYVKDDGKIKQASILYTLSNSGPIRAGYTLIGWNTKADGTGTHYDKGAAFTATASDTILYAEWKLDTFTVSFDSKGGSEADSQEVIPNNMASEPEQPTKADYKFIGWTTDPDATINSALFDFENTSITAATTLYAIWEPHEHIWAYAADGDKLYAYCTVDEYNCSYYGTGDSYDKAIELFIDVDDIEYDGSSYLAEVKGDVAIWESYFTSLPVIQYEYKETETGTYSSLTDDPIDAGYYKASISVNDNTAVKGYRILKKNITDKLRLSMAGYEVDGTPTEPVLTGQEGDGAVTYYYKKKDAADSTYTTTAPTTPWGDYIVKAIVAETKNYSDATKTCDFEITPKERTETISVSMSGYEYGQDSAPTPYINPAASELEENPSVTYKYIQLGASPESAEIWTGNTSALDVNTYHMFAVIGATDSYAECTTAFAEFLVLPGAWKVTAPTVKTGLTYNCAEQELVNAGSVEDDGTLLYFLAEAGPFDDSISKATNVGEYTVYYKVAADKNHFEYGTKSIPQITIAKADWNVTAPTAIAPAFTGSAQALVNAGVVKDANDSPVTGIMLYSLTGDADDYSISIPTACAIGSYTVYYKVDGDANHNEYAAKTVTATIEKVARPDKPMVGMSDYTYGQTGSIPTPVLSATPSENPTVTYYYNDTDAVDGADEWKNITSTTLDAGTYYMFACIGETENYARCYTEFKQFDIAKAACTDITSPAGLTLNYNGQPQALVSRGSSTQGTMVYSLTGSAGDFTAEIPTGTAIGTYTVYYKVAGDVNHNDSAPDSLTVTIGKGIHNVTAPVALNPIANGNAQVLISTGNCTTGTLLYSLDGIEYFSSIDSITASAIGTYKVYYKVEGNTDYDDFGPEELTAKIRKKSSPIYYPPEIPTPVPEETSDEKKAEISDGIIGVEEITEDAFKDILDEISSETTAFTIDLSQEATQEVTGADITAKTLETIADAISDDSNPIESVKIELSEATVELDAKALKAVLESAEGDTVRLVVENTEKEGLNKSQNETLKGYDVDRTFEAYFESAGKRIHDFEGGKALVSISFKPEKGKRVENYKVFYVDEEGRLQKMVTKYENGLITFVTGHFSDYAVIYENVKEVLIAEASMTKKGNIKLTWNEIDGADKYIVYGAKCGTSYKMLAELDAKTDGNSFVVKKINGAKPAAGKICKFYVVAYDELGNKLKSKSIHFIAGNTSAKYGNVETITALQKTLELTVGEKAVVGAEYTVFEEKKHISQKHGRALRFTSDCSDVAKVAKDGTVTAKSEGKAIIYIRDISGKWCTVEVTVKEK